MNAFCMNNFMGYQTHGSPPISPRVREYREYTNDVVKCADVGFINVRRYTNLSS